MLDVLGEELFADEGKEPLAFDSDCREGICGQWHRHQRRPARPATTKKKRTACARLVTATRSPFEFWRSKGFPVIKDLVVDRSASTTASSRQEATSRSTPGLPFEAHSQLVPKGNADHFFEAAACIGCGACVAAHPNGSPRPRFLSPAGSFTGLSAGAA